MKIDKAIFSCSEAFSPCWNLVSEAYSKMGIEPWCLLFGEMKNTDMHEKFGKVVQMCTMPDIPLLIQITWSRFYFTSQEPETTWITGDIDMLPLQKKWFTTNLEPLPADTYAHLDADGIVRLSGSPYKWSAETFHQVDRGDKQDHACNLPAHYHVAKGNVFARAFERGDKSFRDELLHIVNSGHLYGGQRAHRPEDPIDQANLWCAEECCSTAAIRRSVLNGHVAFHGFNPFKGTWGREGYRIENTMIKDGDYDHDPIRLANQQYVDLHCARPFVNWLTQTRKMLEVAGMI